MLRNLGRLLTLLSVGVSLMSSAAPLWTYDLDTLARKAEAIVVAERVGDTQGLLGRYVVHEVVRGNLAVSQELALADGEYVTTWGPGETVVVLFLDRGGESGAWQLLSSGLQQERNGQMYRFTQHNNPGGRLPELDGGDLAAFLLEVNAAAERGPRLVALSTEPDVARRRAAARELLMSRAPWQRVPSSFVDSSAQQALAALVAAGDLEGALALAHLDRTDAPIPTPLTSFEPLLSFAEAKGHEGKLRARALLLSLNARDLLDQPRPVERVTRLLDDGVPAVRAAAAAFLVRTRDWGSSDAAEDKRMRAQARKATSLLRARFAVENDLRALYELEVPWMNRASPPRKVQPELGARLSVRRGVLTLSIVCLGKGNPGPLRLLARSETATQVVVPGAIQLSCDLDVHSSEAHPTLVAGTYALFLEGKAGGKLTEWPLGPVVVSENGAWELDLDS
jgi:hypothetical protein